MNRTFPIARIRRVAGWVVGWNEKRDTALSHACLWRFQSIKKNHRTGIPSEKVIRYRQSCGSGTHDQMITAQGTQSGPHSYARIPKRVLQAHYHLRTGSTTRRGLDHRCRNGIEAPYEQANHSGACNADDSQPNSDSSDHSVFFTCPLHNLGMPDRWNEGQRWIRNVARIIGGRPYSENADDPSDSADWRPVTDPSSVSIAQ